MVRRLVAKPGNLKELCDGVTAIPRQAVTFGGAASETYPSSPADDMVRSRSSGCMCRRQRRYQLQRLRLGAIELYNEDTLTENHYPGCKFSRIVTNDRRQAVGFRFTALTKLLSRAVSMAFYLNTGAGGFGISSDLTYYATVDDKTAPAFQLMEILRTSLYCIESPDWTNWVNLAEVGFKNIERLYAERKASPTDVNKDNQSVLHLASQLVCLHYICIPCPSYRSQILSMVTI